MVSRWKRKLTEKGFVQVQQSLMETVEMGKTNFFYFFFIFASIFLRVICAIG